MDDALIRGADNVVRASLAVTPGERLLIISAGADEIAALVAAAAERASARVTRLDLSSVARDPQPTRAIAALNDAVRGGLDASVFFAAGGVLSTAVSIAVIDTLRKARTRHLHVVGMDVRLLGQSLRADPDRLSALNERLSALLEPPVRVSLSSDAGTDVALTFSREYPLLSANGRPKPGESDNLPSGFVYGHPATLDGTFVADRQVFGSGCPREPAGTRRAPVTFTFAAGRVTNVACASETTLAAVERYLASHPNAGRVGLVVFPTNYLVRSEIGVDAQDELAPGANVLLGFTESAVTRAPFDAPVQLHCLARRLNVDTPRAKLVTAGRFADALVAGVDPFR